MLSHQYETEVTSDGFEAGAKVVKFNPVLIILDLIMPGMDGFKVCRMIKEDPATSHIKILAITGYDTEDNRNRRVVDTDQAVIDLCQRGVACKRDHFSQRYYKGIFPGCAARLKIQLRVFHSRRPLAGRSGRLADDPVLANFQEYGFKGMMPKPFESRSLGKVLNEVLQGEN